MPLPSVLIFQLRYLDNFAYKNSRPESCSSRGISLEPNHISFYFSPSRSFYMQENSNVVIFPEQINCSFSWADGFVCVYSVTDYDSYDLMYPCSRIATRSTEPQHPCGAGSQQGWHAVESQKGLCSFPVTWMVFTPSSLAESMFDTSQELCQEVHHRHI